MGLRTLSDERLRRELRNANEDYSKHMSRIPEHAWQYEPYKSIKKYLAALRQELLRRKAIH